MSTNKRKYGIGKSWDKEEEKLCRAVKRLHTTSGNTEITTSSSEDDARSPFSQAGGSANHAQQSVTQPGLRRAESGPGPSRSVIVPDSCPPGSPPSPRRKQSLHRSRSSSSPPGRMSLGRGRGRGSREDTPDPRAAPPEYSGPALTDELLQDHSSPALQPSPALAALPLRRYRRPASSAPRDIPLAQDRAQGAAQPGSAALNSESAQSNVPLGDLQPSIPEHAQAETSRSTLSSQPQQEHAAPAGSKWALKFRPAPHDPAALSRAAADAVLGIPTKLAGQAGRIAQLPGIGPGSSTRLGSTQALPDAASLPNRLSHIKLSGGASSGSVDIEEPLTPGRTERSTGTSAHQRSMLQTSPTSYDSLYEEANNLLKNLHFQRLLRHGPDSPEPAEKGTLSMS